MPSRCLATSRQSVRFQADPSALPVAAIQVATRQTLEHVLGFCRKGEFLRNNLHHRVRAALAQSLGREGWKVYEELHVISEQDSNRRIDIVAINKTSMKGLILDPTVRFERDSNQAVQVNQEKKMFMNPAFLSWLTATTSPFPTGLFMACFLELVVHSPNLH